MNDVSFETFRTEMLALGRWTAEHYVSPFIAGNQVITNCQMQAMLYYERAKADGADGTATKRRACARFPRTAADGADAADGATPHERSTTDAPTL